MVLPMPSAHSPRSRGAAHTLQASRTRFGGLTRVQMLRARVLPLLPKVGDECSVEKVEKATGLSFDDIDVALGQKLMILSSYGARNGSGTFTRYE